MSNNTDGVAGERLRSFIERIERLDEDKKALSEDVKEIYAEAKAVGFDTKTIREIIKIRKKSESQRQEEQALLDTYKAAIGIV